MPHPDHLERLATNPEPRRPIVLLVDTSNSMQGEPIAALNDGLQVLADQLKRDDVAKNRVELAVIAFGGTVRALDPEHGTEVGFDAEQIFVPVKHFNAPTLVAGGDAPMGHAMDRALAMIEERRRIYKQHALDVYTPWIVLITGGEPADLESAWQAAAEAARADGVFFNAVAFTGAGRGSPHLFASDNRPLPKLNNLVLATMFERLFDSSVYAISDYVPGELKQLADLTGPGGWGQIGPD